MDTGLSIWQTIIIGSACATLAFGVLVFIAAKLLRGWAEKKSKNDTRE